MKNITVDRKYNSPFATQLREALKLRGMSQAGLAKEAKMSEQTISYYANGERLPNTDVLIRLAKVLKVSADYLLGLQDIASPNTDIQAIHNKTGLSELAISYLIDSNWRINDPNLTSAAFDSETDAYIAEEFLCFFNYIIEDFDYDLITNIIKYCNTSIKISKANKLKDKLLNHAQETFDNPVLKDFFDCISISDGKISITVNPEEAQFAMLGYIAELFKELIKKYAKYKRDNFNATLRTESIKYNGDTSDNK